MRRTFLALALMSCLGATRVWAAPDGAIAAEAQQDPPKVEAKPARPASPGYQVVQIWDGSGQALLFDRKHGGYVVIEVGHVIGDFKVVNIADDEVTLTRTADPAREYVLPLATMTDEKRAAVVTSAMPTAATTEPTPVADAPIAPTAPQTPSEALLDPYPAGVLDPYGNDGVREVLAPPEQRATGPSTVLQPPTPAHPATTTPSTIPAIAPTTTTTPTPLPIASHPSATTPAPAAPATTPIAPAVPAPTIVTAPTTSPMHLRKAEVDAMLSDFAGLGKAATMTLGPSGVTLAKVTAGAFFARLGLQAGDRITAINGVRIRSLDDAADLYARLASTTRVDVDVVRGGAPTQFHYLLDK